MKTIDIEGTPYYADVDSLLFQNKYDHRDVIRVDILNDVGTHYELLHVKNGKPTILNLPQFVNIDPEGMREKYCLPPNTPLPARDAEFSCRQDLLQERLNDKMRPVIQIGQWEYRVDGVSHTLRPCFTPMLHPAFLIDDFEITETGYRIYIDQSTGFIIPKTSVGEKGNYIYANIPDIFVLDPVGASKKHDLNYQFFTQRFPVRNKINITTTASFKMVLPNKKRRMPSTAIKNKKRGIK
ncbi:hypothetical protein ACQKLP_11020 [Chitinophaga sp. NPDC101104]|uniref:hypothetical protein n=1 Tax=Chitinophaga sp. NPDC101104 TaxID=3390561 RepID=UPI003D00F165